MENAQISCHIYFVCIEFYCGSKIDDFFTIENVLVSLTTWMTFRIQSYEKREREKKKKEERKKKFYPILLVDII